jgi:DNA polymerase elongation subunit (family B)
MVDIFAIDWGGVDHAPPESDAARYEIRCWAKTQDGVSTLLRIAFTPYFFVAMPTHWSEARRKYFIGTAIEKLGALPGFSQSVTRTPLLGFTNNAKMIFVQLAFPTFKSFQKAKYSISRYDTYFKLKTYESSLDPLLRLFHVRGISPASWINFDLERATEIHQDDADRVSVAGVREFTIDYSHVGPSQCTARPPITIASWDLECVSDTLKFPCPDSPLDYIITIGTSFQKFGDPEPYHRAVVTLKSCDPIEGVEVLAYDTEHEVINAWLNLLRQHDVDCMVGYNTTGFDFRYLYGRAGVCVSDTGEPLVQLHKMGKSMLGGGIPIEKSLSSSAYGDNKYFFLSTPGIMQLDLLQTFRKELKLESYSLANVSKKFLDQGDEKIDLKAQEIFRKFKLTPRDRMDIAVYCIRDVDLPLKLLARLSTLENALEMANATCVPLEYLQTRGQQIRVYSQLIRKARELGFVAPDSDRDAPVPEGKYEGATVLNAERGAYFDIVSALDFASLYPSIIRAHNLCPSTLVLHDQYDNLEGIEYYEVQVGDKTFKFAQNVVCVVPALLEDLATFRKKAKRDMALAQDTGDHFKASLFDAQQKAYKVSANSVYGFFGATKGIFPCIPIAASTTATGRRMIEKSKKLAEELVPGTRVIYGDSVAEYTPIYIRRNGGVKIVTFEKLAKEVEWTVRDDGKEVAECVDTEIWSDDGFTRLECIIRHALDPSKDMVRILTHTGLVDVTSDHSLLTPTRQAVKPSEVDVGSPLMHSDLPQFTLPHGVDAMTNEVEAFELGDYILYNDPVFSAILAAGEDVRRAFWTGLNRDYRAVFVHEHEMSASIVALGTSLGYSVSISTIQRNTRLVRTTFTRAKTTCYDDTIKEMHVIPYDGTYVYDATTSNHHFAAGVGRLVVHNTDSIMCLFKVDEEKRYDMAEHFKVAQRVADTISATFPDAIELEFEKAYWPYLLLSKKRYAGLMFVVPDKHDKVDVKGLQLVRRDNAPIVKDVSTDILNRIMFDRSPEKAVEAARACVARVLNGEEPIEKFVISKALKANYVNPSSQPHVMVAQKIRQRRGYAVPQGERVPYVFVEDTLNCDGLLSARAEDPAFVKEHADEIKLDMLYYINNQLMSPIETLLELLVPDVNEAVLGYPGIKEIIDDLKNRRSRDVKVCKRIKVNAKTGQKEITAFFGFKRDD